MTTSETKVPESFLCPITHEVMEHPFSTTAGNCYEYADIAKWLATSSSDPLSGSALHSKRIVPNNNLRSQIQEWFVKNPSVAARVRNVNAVRPPASAYKESSDGNNSSGGELDQLIRYLGKKNVGNSAANTKQSEATLQPATLQPAFTAYGHSYTFENAEVKLEDGGDTVKRQIVRCNSNSSCVMDPDTSSMFVTSKGVVFYDPEEMQETRILPGTDVSDACKFGASCNKNTCNFAHPFVCIEGVSCKGQSTCKFQHPDMSSVVPKERGRPVDCKYGTACTNKTCDFAHSKGRMALVRTQVRVLVTHTQTLEPLQQPVPLVLSVPEHATRMQFQGEFVFFFEPFEGTWAQEHYKNVIMHKFDSVKQVYKEVGVYSLDKHYCNRVVAKDRYLAISFWPYENEAIRSIWECLRVARSMEKELKASQSQLKDSQSQLKDSQAQLAANQQQLRDCQEHVKSLQTQIAQYQSQLQQSRAHTARIEKQAAAANRAASSARKEAASARKEARLARKEKQASERQWVWMQKTHERNRTERLRLRDPIHIFTLRSGASGLSKDDWVMIVDYHKGAHDIQLGPLNQDGSQTMEITEHSTVYEFRLVAPAELPFKNLPLVPGKLCADF